MALFDSVRVVCKQPLCQAARLFRMLQLLILNSLLPHLDSRWCQVLPSIMVKRDLIDSAVFTVFVFCFCLFTEPECTYTVENGICYGFNLGGAMRMGFPACKRACNRNSNCMSFQHDKRNSCQLKSGVCQWQYKKESKSLLFPKVSRTYA
jgi:hypothetical protein